MYIRTKECGQEQGIKVNREHVDALLPLKYLDAYSSSREIRHPENLPLKVFIPLAPAP